MELGGTWRAVEADEELRRAYPDPDFDDRHWHDLPVPSHWRLVPAFAASDGPLLARRAFTAAPPPADQRAFLVLEGACYQTDIWLDGSYVGDTEGYFFPHAFEITDALRGGHDHVLALELTCDPPRDRTAKRAFTGVLQHWDCIDPGWNPGGLWRPVRIEHTGPVRIGRLRVTCPDASPERARLSLRAILDAAEAGRVEVRTRVGDHTEHTAGHTLAAGENRIEWTVGIDHPRLWWPHALGAPDLEDVEVVVALADRAEASDRRLLRTGLRQVRMRNWILTVNGERLFLKGANHGPTRAALGAPTGEEVAGDVRLAREAGLDLLRIHAHVGRPELYAAADAEGMLLWQDLPLQWGYARGTRKEAARQAREAVDLLGHHPSIAVWCGHNEPLAIDTTGIVDGDDDPAGALRRLAVRMLAGQELPGWNKTVLDATISRALSKADRSRPVIPHSGVLPHPGSGGTDTHVYFGWYHGHERDLPKLLAAWPRLARFVSEFGAQAVPDDAPFLEPERWPDLDWPRLEREHSLQLAVFRRVGLDPAGHASLAAWVEATQRYQADLVRFHIETLRRLKYRPTGGFCHFLLADAQPAVTWSVLDVERRPKQGWEALRAACRPVIVVADRPPAVVGRGDRLALDVHVVSDLREPVPGAVTGAELCWGSGSERWTWQGDIPADDCVRVGTVQAVVPADASGPLTLTVRCDAGDHEAESVYEAAIAP